MKEDAIYVKGKGIMQSTVKSLEIKGIWFLEMMLRKHIKGIRNIQEVRRVGVAGVILEVGAAAIPKVSLKREGVIQKEGGAILDISKKGENQIIKNIVDRKVQILTEKNKNKEVILHNHQITMMNPKTSKIINNFNSPK